MPKSPIELGTEPLRQHQTRVDCPSCLNALANCQPPSPLTAPSTQELQNVLALLRSLGLPSRARILAIGEVSETILNLFSQEGFTVSLLTEQVEPQPKNAESLPDLRTFDLIWFDERTNVSAGSLQSFLSALQQGGARLVVFFLPNPASLPYLLFRYQLRKEGKGEQWGPSYDDLEDAIERSGLRINKRAFFGWGKTLHHIEKVCGPSTAFSELLEAGLIPIEQASTLALIAGPSSDTETPPRSRIPDQTVLVDLVAHLNVFRSSLRVEGEAQAEEIRRLKEQLSEREARIQALSEQCSALASRESALKTELDHHRTQLAQIFQGRYYRVRRVVQRIRELGWKGSASKVLARLLQKLGRNHSLLELKRAIADSERICIGMPVIPWLLRWQRPQQILSRFAENGYLVLLIDMDVTPKGCRYSSSRDASRDLMVRRYGDRIFEVRLSSETAFNVYLDRLENGNLDNLFFGMASLLSQARGKIHYMVQHPGWSSLAFKLKESLGGTVVFDCMDDHSGFSTNSSEAVDVERALIEKSDLVITSAALLYERAASLNPRTILVRNGCEFEHFNKSKPNGQLDHLLGKPLIGYYGAISDWFDMEIVKHCAQNRPDWNFVLIGSTMGADLSGVEDLPNVHFLGEKPYSELPGFFAYFDVCTIPFKILPLTLATNPVKFYEYLSGGKPVVSVKLPELDQYKEHCYLAEDANDFLAMLERALAERNAEATVGRMELARRNSWQERFLNIRDGVENLQ